MKRKGGNTTKFWIFSFASHFAYYSRFLNQTRYNGKYANASKWQYFSPNGK